MTRGRKLLAVSGAVMISITGGAAAATGNLMAVQHDDPPAPKKDAGVADAGAPLTKTDGPKQKDSSKK
jgi:hypothetical protein